MSPKEIQDLRIKNFMTVAEVAARTDLSPTQVANAENPSSTGAANKRRKAIHAAILEHGTGLPHLGREIRWKTRLGEGEDWTGVVIP